MSNKFNKTLTFSESARKSTYNDVVKRYIPTIFLNMDETIANLTEVRAEGDETSLQNQERRNHALNERKSMK